MSSTSQDKTDAVPKAPAPEDPKAEVAVEKRPSTEDNDKSSPSKRQRTGDGKAKKEETEEVVDLCVEMGIKPGDRLEVEWELDYEDDEETASSSGGDVKRDTQWWDCTVLPHDGRTEDGVAIRTLEYDPLLPHYPEKTTDDVIFLSHELVISPHGRQPEYRFRPKGVVQLNGEDETREQINSILMETMEKHAGKWAQLDRAQQGAIAEIIAKKKEMLVQAIMSHSKGPIIGADDMKEILNGIMKK